MLFNNKSQVSILSPLKDSANFQVKAGGTKKKKNILFIFLELLPDITIHTWQTTRSNWVTGGTTGYILYYDVHVLVRNMFARRITIVVQLKRKQEEDLLARIETVYLGVKDWGDWWLNFTEGTTRMLQLTT